MFNRKLKEEVERLKEQLNDKDRYISILRNKIEAIEKYDSKMPADCIYGNYCEVCQFAKVFHIPDKYPCINSWSDVIYVCGRSEVCPNFVKKPNVKEGK